MTTTKPTALITGASKGFGLALAKALGQRGWKLIINARNAAALLKAQRTLEQFTEVTAISGDVRDEIHLLQFVEKLEQLNESLDLVVNNASTLGVSPQPCY
jgi:NADP-dependent 3-hydroxy acid dehydrogenase YdfG